MKFLSEKESFSLIKDRGYKFNDAKDLKDLICKPKAFYLTKNVTKLTFVSCHIFDNINYSEILFFISDWSVWPSSENLNLFYGYRKYLGEDRELVDCPGQVFNQEEQQHFFSLFGVSLYNAWDGYVMIDGQLCIRVSNDETIEIDENSGLGVKIIENLISFDLKEEAKRGRTDVP